MSIYKSSTLAMIPTAYKDGKLYSVRPTDGSGDFTFSRGTTATRVASSGYIEKGRENLLLQSNTFSNASWTKTNSSVTAGQSGYDGGSDAWQVDISASFAQVEQTISTSGVVTYSVYAKAGTLGFVRLRLDASTTAYADFDLASGTAGTTSGIITASSTSLAGGWYRLSLVTNASSATKARIYPIQADNDLTATSGNIYIQDAQLEAGLVATDYIETTTTSVSAGILEDMPRLDYSGSCPSLLLEPQRTNGVVHSEYFGASNWTALRSSIALSSVTSPEGKANAYKLTTDGTANNTHIIYYGGTLTSNTYSLSLYAKAAEFSKIGLGTGNLTLSAKFDLSSGSVITSGAHTASIESAGNDWYRCTIVTTTTTPIRVVLLDNNGNISFDGDGTSGLYIFGHQQEAGSYPTSYIPTYGASVTRSGDDMSPLTTTAILSQTTNNTIYGEITNFKEQAGNARFISLFSSSFSNSDRILIYSGHTGSNYSLNAQYKTSGQSDVNISKSAMSYNDKVKFAVVFDGTEMSLFVNGSLVGSSTIVAANNFYYYDPTNVYGDLGFKMHQVIFFPTALTDSECIALTTL